MSEWSQARGDIWLRVGNDWVNTRHVETIEEAPEGTRVGRDGQWSKCRVYTRGGRVLHSWDEPDELAQLIARGES